MASKRNVRRKSCTGKIRHETIGRAKYAVSRLITLGRTRGGKVLAYYCKFCGGFHVGHNGEPAP